MNLKECRIPSRGWWAACILVLSVLSLAGCRNAAAAKAEHLQRGEQLLADHKYQEAVLEFRNAQQWDEKSGAAHWGLARAYDGLGRYSDSFLELRKTVDLDAGNLAARVKLGHYYLAPRDLRPDFVQAAERLAQEVITRDAKHVEGHILLAAVRLAQNRQDEARRLMEQAVALDPQRVASQLALARFYVKTGNAAEAETAFRKALSLDGAAAPSYLEYGKFLAQNGHYDQAEAAFQQAVKVAPQDGTANLTLAGFLFATKQTEKAEKSYQAWAQASGTPDARAALADFYAATGRLDAATQTYRQILQQTPDYAAGHLRLGEIFLQSGDLAGATAEAETLFKKGDATASGHLLRARVRLQKGDLRGAQNDLEESLKLEPASREGLYYSALAHYRIGQMEQANTYTNELEQRFPDDLAGKLMRLQLKLSHGNTQETLAAVTKLMEKIDDAAKQGTLTPQAATDFRARALTARATAYLQSNNYGAARSDFVAVREAQPNAPDAYLNLALLARREQKWAEAAGYYEKALALDGDNFDAWAGYISTAAELKTLGALQGRLDQVVAGQPDSAPLQYLKGQALAAENRVPEAEAAYQRTLSLDANYVAGYTSLGALYLNQGQDERALEQYRQILARRPDDANTYVLMGLVEDRRQRYDEAADYYRKALENNPNNPIAANNLAWIYGEYSKGSLEEAMRLAQLATQQRPDVVSYADTLGWIYHKKGMSSVAIDQLTKVVAKAGDKQMYRYHLGAAYLKAGRKPEARRELEQALRLNPNGSVTGDATRQLLAQL